MRDLVAGPIQDLLADQLRQEQLARLVAAVLRRVKVRPLGDELAESGGEGVETLACAGADREDLVDALEPGEIGRASCRERV